MTNTLDWTVGLDGIRLSSIIPAGDWVAVWYWREERVFEIKPVAAWALGERNPDPKSDRGVTRGQFVAGLHAPFLKEWAALELVEETEEELVGYFPNEAVAIARIEREHAYAGAPSTIKRLDASLLEVTGTMDDPSAEVTP